MKFVSPIFYAVGLLPVVVAVLLAVTFVENNIGFGDYVPGIGLDNFTTIYLNGDVVALATIVLTGTVVFSVLSRALMWLEQLRVATVADHLRHCALLYAVILFLGFIMFISYESQAGGLGYGIGVILLLIGAYAVSIDALILLLSARRLNRAERGDVR